MRSSACLLSVLLAAGCAGTPDEDSLVWSDGVVRTLQRERGDVVEVARFSRLRPGAALEPCQPW
ncbi:MAG TPA: hypothetical protein VNZ59_12600, partial [Burkholderiales bacterium]|nr:hypothetical protein [Burkholderiales bacterium]